MSVSRAYSIIIGAYFGSTTGAHITHAPPRSSYSNGIFGEDARVLSAARNFVKMIFSPLCPVNFLGILYDCLLY